jgi:hypothetical protein
VGGRRSRTRSWLAACAVVAVAGAVSMACTPMPNDCAGFSPRPLPEFMFGSAATDISASQMDLAPEMGYRWIRVPIRWEHLQPTVSEKPTLTRAELAAHPEYVDEFAAAADWTTSDTALRNAARNGLKVVGFVGVTPPRLNGVTLDPASLGTDTYLASMDLTTRAIVRRYGRDRVGVPDDIPTVEVWQTENELNIAPAASLVNWRTPGGFEGFFSSPWADWGFLTALLQTLRRAVVETDAQAVTVVNLSTDSPAPFNVPFGRPDWPDQVLQWRTLADVVAIDTYPNYYLPGPVDGSVVGRDLGVVRDRVCPGQQYMVMETNYPNGPVARGFSPAKQAEFLQEAWDSSKAVGTSGFMPFAIGISGPDDVVLDARDTANWDLLGVGLRDGDVGSLGQLFLGDQEWVTTRLADVTQLVEGRWGLWGPGKVPYPGFDVVRQIAAETAGR